MTLLLVPFIAVINLVKPYTVWLLPRPSS